MRAPSVPEQQKFPLMSIFTGVDSARWLSLGKTTLTAAPAVLLESDCKVAVTVNEFGDGNELGAVYMAVLPLGCRVPTGLLRLQFTATGVPPGPVAVNPIE